MWALGCVVYEMRVGRAAFVAAEEETLLLRIRNGFKGGTDAFPWLPHMKKDVKGLISALLHKAPAERLTAEAMLIHPWVWFARGGDDGQPTATPPSQLLLVYQELVYQYDHVPAASGHCVSRSLKVDSPALALV